MGGGLRWLLSAFSLLGMFTWPWDAEVELIRVLLRRVRAGSLLDVFFWFGPIKQLCFRASVLSLFVLPFWVFVVGPTCWLRSRLGGSLETMLCACSWWSLIL